MHIPTLPPQVWLCSCPLSPPAGQAFPAPHRSGRAHPTPSHGSLVFPPVGCPGFIQLLGSHPLARLSSYPPCHPRPPSPGAPHPGRVHESPSEVQRAFSRGVRLSCSSATASDVRCGRRTSLANRGPPDVSTICRKFDSGQAVHAAPRSRTPTPPAAGSLTSCRGPNRKCSSSGEEGLAMLPRSRAWATRRARGSVRGHVRLAPPPSDGPARTRSHQQAEGVLDFLKHVRVLALGGRLGPQRQEALCTWGAGGGAGGAGIEKDPVRGGQTWWREAVRRRKVFGRDWMLRIPLGGAPHPPPPAAGSCGRAPCAPAPGLPPQTSAASIQNSPRRRTSG